MKWIEASFKAGADGTDALCGALTQLGAEGLVIEDEGDFRRFLEENRPYWDYVDPELEKRYAGVSRVKLYVTDDDEGRRTLARLTEGVGTEPETAVLEDEDWQNGYKKYYKPIEIGEKLLILPEWETQPEGSTRTVLRLDPGLAFGTGSHETTRMCLEALERSVKAGDRALDLGCGSGILGIGALLLGCSSVAGCDIDPKSPGVARENAALNGIAPERFTMLTGDVLRDSSLRKRLGGGYGVVLANIVADVIIPLAPLASTFLSEDGVFITSGIIDGRQDETRRALESAGFGKIEQRRLGEWHSFVCRIK